MTYKDIRAKMQTGDLIAFSGNSKASKMIKWKTDSHISHVGIVYRNDGDRVVIIESTSKSTNEDIMLKEYVKGVQQQYLSKRIEGYNGKVYWKPLEKTISHFNNMMLWLHNTHGKRTKYDSLQAFGAGIDFWDDFGIFKNERDYGKLFCSELVSKALQVGNVISEDINPSEETPDDVWKYNCYGEHVELQNVQSTSRFSV